MDWKQFFDIIDPWELAIFFSGALLSIILLLFFVGCAFGGGGFFCYYIILPLVCVLMPFILLVDNIGFLMYIFLEGIYLYLLSCIIIYIFNRSEKNKKIIILLIPYIP
jgi:hypothetical protein